MRITFPDNASDVVFLFGLGLVCGLSSIFIGPLLIDLNIARVLFVILINLLVIVILLSLNRVYTTSALYFYVASLIWLSVVVAEIALARAGGTPESAFESRFSLAVIGEIVVWIICMVLLMLVTVIRPGYLRFLFKRGLGWISLFVIAILISVAYSPNPAYSLAWGFKLTIVVLSLAMWSYAIRNLDNVIQTMKVVFLAFILLGIVPFGQVLLTSTDIFSGNRLGGAFAPTGLSMVGGIIFIFSAIFALIDLKYRYFYILLQGFGLVIMLLSGGKTAIIATIIAGIIFFLMLRKYLFALLFPVSLLIMISFAFILKLPIVEYIAQYSDLGLINTLTGRTVLWAEAANAITVRPLLGHGYLSSKFVSLSTEGSLWPAGHMHNSFLEVLYNNGVIGLIPILAMNWIIIRNLVTVTKKPFNKKFAVISSGLFALYIAILGSGTMTSTFGGRPSASFMLFLAIIIVSEKLRDLYLRNK